MQAQITLRNDSDTPQTVIVGGQVQPWVNDAKSGVLDAPEPRWHLGVPVLNVPVRRIAIAPHQSTRVFVQQKVNGRLQFGSPEAPHLHGLVLEVARAAKTIDRQMTRFGWRQFTFEGKRQLLNGQPLELRGDLWHFMGIPQMTRRFHAVLRDQVPEQAGKSVHPTAGSIDSQSIKSVAKGGRSSSSEVASLGASCPPLAHGVG